MIHDSTTTGRHYPPLLAGTTQVAPLLRWREGGGGRSHGELGKSNSHGGKQGPGPQEDLTTLVSR